MPRGQKLAVIQARESDLAARNIGLLTIDEARRIATGIVRLPELLGGHLAIVEERFEEIFGVKIEVDRVGGGLEMVARLTTGRLGMEMFEAAVRVYPDRTVILTNGTHRLKLYKPGD